MKTTKVQLPDGRLLTIEGGADAAAMAGLLTNHYLKNTAPAHNLPGEDKVENEDVLAIPALTFETFAQAQEREQARQAATPAANVTISANEEVALALPSMA